MITFTLDPERHRDVIQEVLALVSATGVEMVDSSPRASRPSSGEVDERRRRFLDALDKHSHITAGDLVELGIVERARSVPAFLAAYSRSIDGPPPWVSRRHEGKRLYSKA